MKKKRTCKFEGCEKPHKAKGYCDSHYWQLKNGKELTVINKRIYKKNDFCLGCGKDWDTVTYRNRNLCTVCYNIEYNIKNKKRIKEKRRERYLKNKEKELEWEKRYRKTLKGKLLSKLKSQKRRSKIKLPIPKNIVENLLIIRNNICGNIYCNKKIDARNVNIEHSLPISRGGDNYPDNLDVWCASCNFRKHDKTLEEFY